MVPFSRIDCDLQIFQNKKVIVWGEGQRLTEILSLFAMFHVEVSAVCTNEKKKDFESGIPVITAEELLEISEEIVLQLAFSTKDEKNLREGDLFLSLTEKEKNLDVISSRESKVILQYLVKEKKAKENPEILFNMQQLSQKLYIENKSKLEDYMSHLGDTVPLLLCLPTKTGDHTLIDTFEKHGISHHFMHHYPESFEKEHYVDQFDKIKVITAVRDPFSKIFSMIFDEIKVLDESFYLWACHLTELPDSFMKKGGDVQYLFDQLETSHFFHMPLFFQRFQKSFVNLFKYPFDQEKGYTIIKEGNMEVFVYQLEKLNHLLPALSEFTGCPLSELSLGYETSALWCAEAYERGKRDVVISRDYFENTYSELWLSHFYSDDDIEVFKNRWEKNIK